jgi:D-amino-acid dehydrogenase
MTKQQTHSQVLVIGAGIVGIACAHYLNQAGYQVTVIDKGQVGSGCSAGNCGHICPSHVLPLNEPGAVMTGIKSFFNSKSAFRIKPQLSVSLARWLWEFTLRCSKQKMLSAAKDIKPLLDSSMQEYHQIVNSLDCDWQSKGLLYVLETEQGVERFAQSNDMLSHEFGVTADFMSGSELTALDPAYKDGLAGAFHYPGDTHLHPDRLINSWVTSLKQAGVLFIENCELTQMTKSNGQAVSIHTSSGVFTADHYVVATGAWSKKLARDLNCSIPIQPGKGYSLTMSRPEICPTHPAFFSEHGIGVTPFEHGYRLGSMMEFSGFDSSISEKRIRLLKELAKPYLKEPFTDIDNVVWQGWRPMTWDSLPIIGRLPSLKNTYLATGHNMLGVTMAPGTGKLISEIIQEQSTHIDNTPFQPSRFN